MPHYYTILIYFLYGLSFFMLGFSAYQQYYLKEHNFYIIRYVVFLALFGLLHGLLEWLIMFYFILGESFALYYGSLGFILLNTSSYLFLFLYGLGLLKGLFIKTRYLFLIPVSIFLIHLMVLVIVFVSFPGMYMDYWIDFYNFGRYFLGLPASIIVAVSLLLYYKITLPKGKKSKNKGIFLMAVLFMLYGFFAGVIGTNRDYFPANTFNNDTFFSWIGIPVELVRMFLAFGILVAFLYEHKRFLTMMQLDRAKIQSGQEIALKHRKLKQYVHDQVIQDLFAMGLYMQNNPDQSDTDKHHVNNQVESIILGLRKQIQDENESNFHSISILFERIEQIRQKCQMMTDKQITFVNGIQSKGQDAITLDALNNLFYIIHEATLNAVKHSTGNKITIRLDTFGYFLIIQIEDNGKPMIKTNKENHYGLSLMKQRAKELGAFILFKSYANGFVVRLTIPREVLK